MLIASPQMRDPHFERAVVLLCKHDEAGALGLVINREGPVTIGAVATGMKLAPPLNPRSPTWLGGPVDRSMGFVIWRGRHDLEDGWTLGEDIAISPSVDRLTELIRAGDDFHLALGYAGWAPAQLDAEIASGAWLYADADPDIVFETPMPERYARALALLGLTPETVWMQPIYE